MGIMALTDDLCNGMFDFNRSTKGASKLRRDHINGEIATMRDLLPLPESSRLRLSQLQVMSLSCVYIRKCTLLQKAFGGSQYNINTPFDFFQSLTGFMLVTTKEGKLLYISENVTEYLGHSMVDMKTQGDSIYDIIDKRDHSAVQSQLLQACAGAVNPEEDVTFFCRMNMSRCLKRHAGQGDIKIMHVKGHFIRVPGTDSGTAGAGTNKTLLMAVCCPLITPDIKENLIQNNTMVFKTIHQLDMRFLEITENAEHHLQLKNDDIFGKSWYGLLHPDDMYEARDKHVQLIRSRHEMGCMLTVRLMTSDGEFLWLNVVMHVRQALLPDSNDPVIVCINQVISEKEAYLFKIQSQLYSLHMTPTGEYMCSGGYPTSLSPGIDSDGTYVQASALTYPVQMAGYFHPSGTPATYSQLQLSHADMYMMAPGTPVDPQSPGLAYIQSVGPSYSVQREHSKDGKEPGSSSKRVGHAQAVQALKRKLGENAMGSCKPSKISRLSVGSGGYHEPSYGVFPGTGHIPSTMMYPPRPGMVTAFGDSALCNYGTIVSSPISSGYHQNVYINLKDTSVETAVDMTLTPPSDKQLPNFSTNTHPVSPVSQPSPGTLVLSQPAISQTSPSLPVATIPTIEPKLEASSPLGDWYLTPEASPTSSSSSVTEAELQAFAKLVEAKLEEEMKTEVETVPSCCAEKSTPVKIPVGTGLKMWHSEPSIIKKRHVRDLPNIDPFTVEDFFTDCGTGLVKTNRINHKQDSAVIPMQTKSRRELPLIDPCEIEDFFRVSSSPLAGDILDIDVNNNSSSSNKNASKSVARWYIAPSPSRIIDDSIPVTVKIESVSPVPCNARTPPTPASDISSDTEEDIPMTLSVTATSTPLLSQIADFESATMVTFGDASLSDSSLSFDTPDDEMYNFFS